MNIGDKVTILWENLPTLFDVEITYIPVSDGDSWGLKDKNGVEYKVMSFCLMRREVEAGNAKL
jgi:hypothetical protein